MIRLSPTALIKRGSSGNLPKKSHLTGSQSAKGCFGIRVMAPENPHPKELWAARSAQITQAAPANVPTDRHSRRLSPIFLSTCT